MPIPDLLYLVMAVIEEKINTDQIKRAFERQKKEILKLRREPVSERIERLKSLRDWIHKNRPAIHQALYDDFRKPAVEVDGTETFHVLNEISYALSHIENWVAPKKIDAPITMFGTRSYIQYEPRGVCLIISPWNYPFSLAVGPLVSALAAGNAVVLKPSEISSHVSTLLARMVSELFDEKVVYTCEGGPEVSTYLLSLPFDHIFFTGSPAVGKIVMRAAANNLTSVTLELGGKSPAIVSDAVNINDAAERIAVGKFINNGQTCVAPDYLLVHEKIADSFVKKLIDKTQRLFSEKGDYEQSASYCRIINQKHFTRLNDVLQDALDRGAKLEHGGKVSKDSCFFHPMILSQVPLDSRVMEDEIFGPILPIVTYNNIDEAISVIQSKPKPLALYVFSKSKQIQNKVLQETSAGAVCINDCAIHFLHHNLPFGGVNNSGMGKSHGYYGFLAFSNEKPVLKQKGGFTSIKPFYPPYTNFSKKLMDWFLKFF